MNNNKCGICWICGLLLSLGLVGSGIAAADMPNEPSEANLINEDVNIITGLYIREYSLKGDGIVDYKTARQIIFYENNKFWNTVVETEEWPLFYWVDANRDGIFDQYVDQRVEGKREYIIPYLPVSEK
ncbi:MAG: hypothetical protein KC592_00840 [Nitrospira sp.]|nr:hypothetical protein [Nitrospira sp.]HBP86596.1 hypothetical protein [Nitrospiraceae bacterium]HNP27749.1 hypothetical protein [Nitrospirales bacterium]